MDSWSGGFSGGTLVLLSQQINVCNSSSRDGAMSVDMLLQYYKCSFPTIKGTMPWNPSWPYDSNNSYSIFPSIPELCGSSCVKDTSVGAAHPMVSCSLNCDQMWPSAAKWSFFDEETDYSVIHYIYIWISCMNIRMSTYMALRNYSGSEIGSCKGLLQAMCTELSL